MSSGRFNLNQRGGFNGGRGDKGGGRPPLKCFSCQQFGHRASECPNARALPQDGNKTGNFYRTSPKDGAAEDYSNEEHTELIEPDQEHITAAIHTHAEDRVRHAAETSKSESDAPDASTQQKTIQPTVVQIEQAMLTHGLRTSFGTGGKLAEIATNYLTLKRPSRMYVYKVVMIRSHGIGLNPILVAKKADKMLVMTKLIDRTPELKQVPPATAVPFAYDDDLIWSTDPLWSDAEVEDIVRQIPSSAFTYRNEAGVTLTLEDVYIRYEHDMNVDRPVGQLFYDAHAASFDQSIPAILTRGLNAFLTAYVRQPGNSGHVAIVGGNRSFNARVSGALSEVMRALRGFFVSTRPGTHSLPININTSTSAFFEGMRVSDFLRHASMSNKQKMAILKGVKVRMVNNTNQFHIILRVNVQHQQISLETATMIANALRSPQRNANLILERNAPSEGLFRFGFAGTSAGTNQGGLSRFGGMQAGTDLVKIKGRWLAAPALDYGAPGHNERSIQKATWNLSGKRFTVPTVQSEFSVLDMTDQNSVPRSVGNDVAAALLTHGLTNVQGPVWSRRALIFPPNGKPDKQDPAFERAISNELTGFNPKPKQPVLVIIQKKDFDIYAAVKRAGNLQVGVKSICITYEDNLCKERVGPDGRRWLQPQKASNIALKYNIKNSGSNHLLANHELGVLRQVDVDGDIKAIVLGADVAHPGPGAIPGSPSVAAVVGTTDAGFMQFPGSMRLQTNRKEGIQDFGCMVDGVSESQYEYVRAQEIPQVQKAFNEARDYLNSLHAHPKPVRISDVDFKLTVVVAGKRHNTRFYPLSDADSFKNSNRQGTPYNGNVKPGLLVDNTITHPYNMNFFLQSHNLITGTGRSAHYYVITNGMGLSANDLQSTTHAFCYAYARATRGISYCAHTYYADRLCDRGRAYVRHWLLSHDHPTWAVRDKLATETHDQYLTFVRNHLEGSSIYRPYATANPNHTRYGRQRLNPWHPERGDIMFYL